MPLAMEFPDHGSGDRIPVAVYYNMATQGRTPAPGRAYQEGDLLIEVASTHCPPNVDTRLVCVCVIGLISMVSAKPGPMGIGNPKRPLPRALQPGDAISIDNTFYTYSGDRFEVLLGRPSNLVQYVQFSGLG